MATSIEFTAAKAKKDTYAQGGNPAAKNAERIPTGTEIPVKIVRHIEKAVGTANSGKVGLYLEGLHTKWGNLQARISDPANEIDLYPMGGDVILVKEQTDLPETDRESGEKVFNTDGTEKLRTVHYMRVLRSLVVLAPSAQASEKTPAKVK